MSDLTLEQLLVSLGAAVTNASMQLDALPGSLVSEGSSNRYSLDNVQFSLPFVVHGTQKTPPTVKAPPTISRVELSGEDWAALLNAASDRATAGLNSLLENVERVRDAFDEVSGGKSVPDVPPDVELSPAVLEELKAGAPQRAQVAISSLLDEYRSRRAFLIERAAAETASSLELTVGIDSDSVVDAPESRLHHVTLTLTLGRQQTIEVDGQAIEMIEGA